MTNTRRYHQLAAAAFMIVALAACGNKQAQGPGGAGMPPTEVGVVTVQPHAVGLTTELPGRLEATRVAQVRARVAGIVLKRTYQEGSDVKAGEVLFRIDPAQYQASLDSAKAQLARAEATQTQAQLKAERYKPLVATNAISKQDYDDAVAAAKQATADVGAARAAVDTAKLNLGYATVTSPISGRAGLAQVTEGALVGQGGDATLLATVQQIDPIYLTFTQSSTEVMRLQEALKAGKLAAASDTAAKVTLVTEDGRVYAQTGKLYFSDLTVDQTTGSITLRAIFPNAERTLLPGMYVRARLEQAVDQQAITVPQQAVSRGADGSTVMIVDAEGKVAPRKVQADRAVGTEWIVASGLQAGDKVIVDGLQKVRPGAPVKPVAWQAGGAPSQGATASAPAAKQ
ncbi:MULTISPECIES: efflux RND transporter periplasmic adaptor subunit [Ralstonia solanacearum species complex]|uniref:Efflux RND transporter periplasmic adaptor subunit n=1 Tax=Ralstonia solanacearum TaxID=305 RepID=A0AAD0WHC1_RALSL|nr:efflux RND transporter periplasmic adaptor subunit [Ralstonia solanacearum]BEU73632.1 efflux RND transporter periplasmic adaptor BpeA [Ralstonia pseudosolanacearum]AMP39001.1 efflux transporter periplasmic adaptor subunit [Ralstonia solanacearum]AXV78404.1 efflux RND transporter periplasmic adaptor subunit [Ralstonia solanacearum]AXV83013.1 efflux RND transporter periplasmic adaptor subunit [Ralstonia solanacearum]AXV87829.1 efflux RND transporter periplasmic adaptor subunit [Ralstonia sola